MAVIRPKKTIQLPKGSNVVQRLTKKGKPKKNQSILKKPKKTVKGRRGGSSGGGGG